MTTAIQLVVNKVQLQLNTPDMTEWMLSVLFIGATTLLSCKVSYELYLFIHYIGALMTKALLVVAFMFLSLWLDDCWATNTIKICAGLLK